MAGSVLVVDLGSYAGSAAVTTGDRLRLVPDPVTGSARWPASALHNGAGLVVGGAAEQHRDAAPGRYVPAVRRAVDAGTTVWLGDRQYTGVELATAYLRCMVEHAQRTQDGPIDRLVLTVPPGYPAADPRRSALLSAATAAGFPDAELVADSAAATLDPEVSHDLPDGALVLVCDLGATWTVALLEWHPDGAVQLAQETSGAGRDFDLLLLQGLRVALADRVEPVLGQGGETGARAYYQLTDFVRRLKHRLSDVDRAADQLPGLGAPYQLSRAELDRFAEPALRWLLASCRAVVAQARVRLTDVAAVVLAGGGSRLRAAHAMVAAGLALPVRQAAEPELTAVRGAARWAVGTGGRRLPPERPMWRVEPLSWRIPDGQARLLRWLVAEGQGYPAGALLAQVRTADDRVYDLTAEREGVLLEHRLRAGVTIPSAAVAATTRSAAVLAQGRLNHRHHLRPAADWLLSTDRRYLIECGDRGEYIRVRDISSGGAVSEVRAPGTPEGGRPGVGPDGRLAYVSWDGGGHFGVWDVLSGAALAHFKTPDRPAAVLIDEARWRLVAESGRRVQVGRYQRDTATVWDLSTGGLIEEMVGEDLHRRYAGFATRTGADAFGAAATSPDGRVRAVVAAAAEADPAGPAVLLIEAATGQEVFRTGPPAPGSAGQAVHSARVGFSADGRHVLVHWRCASSGWVDVWDL